MALRRLVALALLAGFAAGFGLFAYLWLVDQIIRWQDRRTGERIRMRHIAKS